MKTLEVFIETWALKEPFVIARGSRTETRVIKVEISCGGKTGRGECVPTARYGETIDSVYRQLEGVSDQLRAGASRHDLTSLLPAGAARNAADCALWDLEAKQQGATVSELLDLPYPDKVCSVQTISIGNPEHMGRAAAKLQGFPMLKVKLDAEQIIQRLEAVHTYAPNSGILVDANESWTVDLLTEVAPFLRDYGVVMVEQPLPVGRDNELCGLEVPVPLGADESCHTTADVKKLSGLYDVVNIKLDKTGGLTEAVQLANYARGAGLDIMVGCMVGTSLSMAPAMVLATGASYVDLDAPALLRGDRKYGLTIKNGEMSRLDERLWGGPMDQV